MIKKALYSGLIFLIIFVVAFYYYGRSIWVPVYKKYTGLATLVSVYKKYGIQAEARLIPYFKKAGVTYPPTKIKLLVMKSERLMELWARSETDSPFVKIRQFKVRAASGQPGPKLKEGDKQVPEGIYKIIALNPNSSFHLSMMLNYPNEFDKKYAKKEGRLYPGSNIFIHGKALSVGCLAMGDVAIEELFVLIYKSGIQNIKVIIAPYDPRKVPLVVGKNTPLWLAELYKEVAREFAGHRNDSL
ncbi:Glutamate synthase [NADPH] large chain [hydrothermal vent metagenome]|uniref:Glutamate synthase [NADPH] large chain n=1 Tax=hydrothermal vent metagenome TaxID=652676 RepID=A0A3B0Z092_9ZZZZ